MCPWCVMLLMFLFGVWWNCEHIQLATQSNSKQYCSNNTTKCKDKLQNCGIGQSSPDVVTKTAHEEAIGLKWAMNKDQHEIIRKQQRLLRWIRIFRSNYVFCAPCLFHPSLNQHNHHKRTWNDKEQTVWLWEMHQFSAPRPDESIFRAYSFLKGWRTLLSAMQRIVI